MLLNCGVGEDSWEPLGLQEDPTNQSQRKSVLNIHWRGWCWSWNSNTLATWCEELTYWKRPWCWERLKVGGEGHNRGWGGWMASPTGWTWVWVDSGRSWWWTGKPGMFQSMGLQSQTWLSDWSELMKNSLLKEGGNILSHVIDLKEFKRCFVITTRFMVVSTWIPIKAQGEDEFIWYFLNMQNYRSESQPLAQWGDLASVSIGTASVTIRNRWLLKLCINHLFWN